MSSAARDWAALPRDDLFSIFLKLGPREIMLGAEFVCTTWVEEPALWRHIGYETIDKHWRWLDANANTKMERLAFARLRDSAKRSAADSTMRAYPTWFKGILIILLRPAASTIIFFVLLMDA